MSGGGGGGGGGGSWAGCPLDGGGAAPPSQLESVLHNLTIKDDNLTPQPDCVRITISVFWHERENGEEQMSDGIRKPFLDTGKKTTRRQPTELDIFHG